MKNTNRLFKELPKPGPGPTSPDPPTGEPPIIP